MVFIRNLLIALILFLLILINLSLGVYLYFSKDLPKIQSIKDYRPETTTEIYDRNGRLIYRLYNQRRTYISIERLPDKVINAFLAAEDADFFKHRGIDLGAILRALFTNLLSGRTKQGGSTITQQVVKTFFLSPERTITRKIKEAILSYKLEKNLTKREILELYLNQVYFGAGNYGIYEASRYFFNKSPQQLSISEAAFIASLVKAPENYASLKNPQRVRDRQIHIIRQMEKNGFISHEEAVSSIESPLNFEIPFERDEMNYSISYALKQIKERIESSRLYSGGLKIYLTIDRDIDKVIQRELMNYLSELNSEMFSPLRSLESGELDRIESYMRNRISEMRGYWFRICEVFGSKDPIQDKRLAFRLIRPYKEGMNLIEYIEKDTAPFPVVEGELYLGIVVNSGKDRLRLFTGESVVDVPSKGKKRLFKNGDLVYFYLDERQGYVITGEPLIQGAVILLDNPSGEILGMSGGFHYRLSEFNRAVQAKRQPGSAFKPILYSYAIERGGYNIVSIESDTPVEYTDPQTGKVYRPLNYDRDEFKGEMTLIDAITESKNTISVKLLLNLGIEKVSDFVKGLALDADVRPYPSLALGAFEISLISLSRFYSALADGGVMKRPLILLSIRDERGEEVIKREEERKEVILPDTAYIVTRMLEDVVQRGTGRAAHIDGISIAGKTGTTNNYTNAWFIGYTPQITAGVLIGRDDNVSMGRGATGGNFAAPLFRRILLSPEVRKILDNRPFSPPPSIRFVPVDIHTGKRCEEESESCKFLPFREGTEPVDRGSDSEQDIMRIER